jgi:hypothetical protein
MRVGGPQVETYLIYIYIYIDIKKTEALHFFEPCPNYFTKSADFVEAFLAVNLCVIVL